MTRNATFTVTLSEPPRVASSVSYRTKDKSAIAGKDYTRTSGQLNYGIGETSKTVVVPIQAVSDRALTFQLTFDAPSKLTVYRSSTGTATIQPDNVLVAKVNLAKAKKADYLAALAARDAAQATATTANTALSTASSELAKATNDKNIADIDYLNAQRTYDVAEANAQTLLILAAQDPATYGAAAFIARQTADNALAAKNAAQTRANNAAAVLATKTTAYNTALAAYNAATSALSTAQGALNTAELAYNTAANDAKNSFVGSTKLEI